MTDKYDSFQTQADEAWANARREACSGDASLLAAMLSSCLPDAPTLAWLSELFDAKATSEFIAKIQRRRPGKPPKPNPRLVRAGYYVAININATDKLDNVIDDAVASVRRPGEPDVRRSTLIEFVQARWPGLLTKAQSLKRQSRNSGN